ncbi:dihydroorotase [Spirochaetia bacterium]|nr:dihydroorotase [Spirochaetia bacterium]
MLVVLKNFRIIDESTDMRGSVVIENGIIRDIISDEEDFPDNLLNDKNLERCVLNADMVIEGGEYAEKHGLILMPAFVDIHAHFRDPGFPEKETLESASLAAAAGGYGTVVCMANTKPVTDTVEKALALKNRAANLGLIDLYPVLSLTKNMEGKELSGITALDAKQNTIHMLSEDGKDVADDNIFLAAFAEARRLDIPVSCHCDAGGPEAEAAKKAGKGRDVWSRIEENVAVKRAIELGRKVGAHVHIAHVSTKESVNMIREAKRQLSAADASSSYSLSCEAAPHHIALTEDDARALGDESYGRVNPSLRSEEDRRAVIDAILDGTIDAIATDHAPHSDADKAGGAPGFTGLETGFAVCFTSLTGEGSALENSITVDRKTIDLKRLSFLMSANPARILDLADRGRIAPGLRADLVIVDTKLEWTVKSESFKSRGKNSPFKGRTLGGKILLTLHGGRIVYDTRS